MNHDCLISSRVSWGLVVCVIGVLFLKVSLEGRLRKEHPPAWGSEGGKAFIFQEGLSQGLWLAALGGFRGPAADWLWLKTEELWEKQEWVRLHHVIDLVAGIQPRNRLFWEMGARHLAWNAALFHRNNAAEPNFARRILAERYWVQKGREHLERGVRLNPMDSRLWVALGWLHEQRSGDYREAARCYLQALSLPDVPVYVERLAGHALEKSGDLPAAYEHWKRLWDRKELWGQKKYGWDIVEKRLRSLETQLSISKDKKVFPEK